MNNIKYYLKNGTLCETPISVENLGFYIISYDVMGERKFSYENDEILLNIDGELVLLYDKLRDIYFPDTEDYYRQLNSMPQFIQQAGQNSDCALTLSLIHI